jgi:IS1 transposase
MFEVRRTEDDLSFLRNYLTPEIVQRLNLFAYGSNCTHPPGKQCPQCHTVVITARGGCFTSVDLMVEDSPLLCPMEAEQAPSFSLASSEAINRSETPSADEWERRRGLSSELDEMWSYVGKKANQRWLWHAIDHYTEKVLAYVFGERKDDVFLRLKAL